MSNSLIPSRGGRRAPSLFQQIFDDNFFPSFFTDDWAAVSHGMRADIQETEDAYVVEMEIPGAKKDAIDIRLENGMLSVSTRQEQEVNEEKKNYIRRERRYGQYSRCFRVEGIDEDKVSADYRDGVLTINLPKREQTQPEGGRRIELN